MTICRYFLKLRFRPGQAPVRMSSSGRHWQKQDWQIADDVQAPILPFHVLRRVSTVVNDPRIGASEVGGHVAHPDPFTILLCGMIPIT